MSNKNKLSQILTKTSNEEIQFRDALNQHAIVSVTNIKGTITYVNEKFCNISGYSKDELIGQNHRILNSGTHNKDFFMSMWRQIAAAKTWHGTICNKRKNGDFYWVESSITPILNKSNKPVEYISIRTDVTTLKESEIKAREVEKRQAKQQIVLMALVKDKGLYTYSINKAFETITKLTCETLDVKSVCVWLLNKSKNSLNCRMRYSDITKSYNQGEALLKEHNFDLYELIESKRIVDECKNIEKITVTDNGENKEDKNFIKSSLLIPIWTNGLIVGLLSVDSDDSNRIWFKDEYAFSISISDLVADFVDNSKNKQLAHELQKSERRLTNAQRVARMGSWEWDVNDETVYWSEVIYEVYGVEQNNFIPDRDNIYSFVHHEDKEKLTEFERNIISGIKDTLTCRIVRLDGVIRYISIRGEVEYNDNNEPSKLYGTLVDITEQVELEKELSRQKGIFESIFRDAQDALVMVDIDRKIVMVNPAFSDLFGYQEDEVLGKTTQFLYENKDEYEQQVEKRYNTKESYLNNNNITQSVYEISYRRKNGETFISNTTGSILKEKDGNPLGFLGHVRNITFRKNAEALLIEAKDLAEKANQAKSEFLSNMSHELRTPMNAILGFSQLLKMNQDNNLSDSQLSDIDEIVNAGEHLMKLINEILDLSRIESGGVDINLESVNSLNLIKECKSIIEPIARKHDITIKIIDTEDLLKKNIELNADKTRLRQVLLNLLSNAIKYNNSNGVVEISCEATCLDRLRISVKDTGIGLSENNIKKIFTSFQRFIEDKNTIEGTGIGLVISKRLIELMGGEIGVTSKLGEGSVFWFELRVSENQSDVNSLFPVKLKSGRSVSKFESFTILYIEDNPANLRLVTEILSKRSNIKLISALTPELGLELLNKHLPSLVLLDINLPRMSGYEVLSVIKKNNLTKNIPVVAVSANALKEDVEKAKRNGFSDYLIKPLNVANFYNVIDEYETMSLSK